ncbi:hypothetical protein [Agrilutibacter solisilvae]|uniref:Uncharacterized protein n=1 Tax=Agrilutibacter solisilvae TaxID=2763317 RepID=A0A974XW66_9GAMM|nr:hypothetical protein [Lysobacter solisilvae]QSX77009.1 hypothetical protein I8J32_009280 [Lysobacter solisilvae]
MPRLAPPPPDICFYPKQAYAALLHAVATALSALDAHDDGLARAMDLGDSIDLPPGAPNALDRAALQAAAPLYFASELEKAGLLPTADLVCGLFASGTVTQPLGPTAQLLHAFWRGRRERLDANEREAIFARVIEAPHFDVLMAGLCEALVAQADGSDLREGVTLSARAMSMGEFLAQRVDPMATLAARDIVATINTALGFLRDRLLQVAFGVNSLWALVAIARQQDGAPAGAGALQQHVEAGRSGQTVLLWLAEHFSETTPQLDLGDPAQRGAVEAAQRWLASRPLAARQQRPQRPESAPDAAYPGYPALQMAM